MPRGIYHRDVIPYEEAAHNRLACDDKVYAYIVQHRKIRESFNDYFHRIFFNEEVMHGGGSGTRKAYRKAPVEALVVS